MTAFSITTVKIAFNNATLNTYSFQQSDTQHPVSFIYCFAVCCNDKCGYAGYCYTGCLYAECPGALATENKIFDIL